MFSVCSESPALSHGRTTVRDGKLAETRSTLESLNPSIRQAFAPMPLLPRLAIRTRWSVSRDRDCRLAP